MTTALELDFKNDSIEIEDPSDQDSWLKAFEPLMQKWAQSEYGLKYEQRDDDFDAKKSKSLSECVGIAMSNYRKEVADSLVSDEPFTEWQYILGDAISRELYGEMGNDHDANDYFLHGETFTALYECISEAMEEHDGPVCDLDELIDKIRHQTRYKMEDLDYTTIFDEVGKQTIKLMYVPGFDPNTQNVDNFDINPSEISTRAPGLGHQALLNLARVSIPELMEMVEVDQDDSELIDAWLELEDPVAKAEAAGQPLTPLFTSSDDLQSLFENTNGNSYVLPCWVGSLTFNDLKKIDPTKPLELSGGIVFFNDYSNGSGFDVHLDDSAKIIVPPDHFLGKEYGHSVEETFGLTRRSLAANIKNHEPIVLLDKVVETGHMEPEFS
jgi:hypothetical protein